MGGRPPRGANSRRGFEVVFHLLAIVLVIASIACFVKGIPPRNYCLDYRLKLDPASSPAFPLRSPIPSPVAHARDGAQPLSDLRVPVLSIVCEPCGRRERHDVERLQGQYGCNAKLTDLLPALLTDCPKTRVAASIHERCKAVFGGT
jgi:hypothetical protein